MYSFSPSKTTKKNANLFRGKSVTYWLRTKGQRFIREMINGLDSEQWREALTAFPHAIRYLPNPTAEQVRHVATRNSLAIKSMEHCNHLWLWEVLRTGRLSTPEHNMPFLSIEDQKTIIDKAEGYISMRHFSNEAIIYRFEKYSLVENVFALGRNVPMYVQNKIAETNPNNLWVIPNISQSMIDKFHERDDLDIKTIRLFYYATENNTVKLYLKMKYGDKLKTELWI